MSNQAAKSAGETNVTGNSRQSHRNDLPVESELNLKTDTRQANWRRANPEKYLAHVAVQRALASGDLVKQPCEVCGDPAVDAHHDDYSKQLDVRWLCRQHHVRLHNGGEDLFGEYSANGRATVARQSRHKASRDVTSVCQGEG